MNAHETFDVSEQEPPPQPLLAEDRLGPRHWKLSVAAGMASYLDSAIFVALATTLALWRERFDLSTWQLGVLSSCLTFAVGLGSLFGGRVADLLGRQRVFTIYIVIYAVGMAIMTMAANQAMLFGGVIIAGLAAGADLPTSVAVVSERSPGNAQGRLVSVTALMWSLGIAVTQLLAFAFSGLGVFGARLIFGELALAALVTWALRKFSKDLRSLETDVHRAREGTPGAGVKIKVSEILTTRLLLAPIVLTVAFYISWGIPAATFGQFQTYFLITVGGASQTLATGLGSALIPIGIIAGLIVVRIMDTPWRNRLFVVAAALQVAAMVVAGFGGGVIAVYVVALAMFSLGATFAGDAIFRVWTQESLPVEARATALGFTNGIGRFVFGLFAIVSPTMLNVSPERLLGLLVIFAALAMFFGILMIRYLNGRGIRPGKGIAHSHAE